MSNILGATDFYLNRLFFSAGILIVTFIISLFFKKSLDLVFMGVKRKVTNAYVLSKTRTIRSLLKNIIEVVLFLIAILIILSNLGVNIAPILTGAGIIGLAFSFGAQTLVKDLIAGFFIIVENQFNIGDKVLIGKLEGEVYRMTLRMTVLKDDEGNLIYIPNSQIITVVKLVGK
jgi:small conductance mechanosensitive channel